MGRIKLFQEWQTVSDDPDIKLAHIPVPEFMDPTRKSMPLVKTQILHFSQEKKEYENDQTRPIKRIQQEIAAQLAKTEIGNSDMLNQFLYQLSTKTNGPRLFALRDEDQKKISYEGNDLYFSSRREARGVRNELDRKFRIRTFITNGPDHTDSV